MGYIAADALDPDVVYGAVSGPFVYRSVDAGATFQRFAEFDDFTSALAMSPDGSHFWVATRGGSLNISRDRGQTWERVPRTPYRGYLRSLSPSPHDPRVLFAVTDGGELWAYREPEPDSRDAADFPIPGGRFYTQTSPSAHTGFAVTDRDGIAFFSAFKALPLQSVGYPVSERFVHRGFTTQLFEKLALQGQPEGRVSYLNLLDELHDDGMDRWLEDSHGIPPPEDTSADTGLSWEQVVARHLAILDGAKNQSLKAAYLRDPRWLDLYGLPMGYAEGETFAVVRGQRAVLKLWKADAPGHVIGSVSVEYGVDLAKEAGLFPPEAMVPQAPPAP